MINSKTVRYSTATFLLALALGMSACTSPPLSDVEAGAEIVEEEGLVQGEEIVVESSEIDDEPLSVGVLNARDNMIRASRLLGYDFRNINGDVTGQVENILLDVVTGNILFVTVEYGGVFDIGETNIAMPLSAFSWGSENELVLNIEEERLENFPNLGDDWPDLSNNVWDDEVNQFWLDNEVNPGINIEDDMSQVMYLSEFMEHEIGDIGFGEAEIHDVLINLSQSRGRYVIADYGVDLFEDNLIAIPFNAFHGRVIDDQLHFNEAINLEVLERTPTLARAGFDEALLFERDFDRDIINFWDGEGYTVEHNEG